jgi:hypothetical protein
MVQIVITIFVILIAIFSYFRKNYQIIKDITFENNKWKLKKIRFVKIIDTNIQMVQFDYIRNVIEKLIIKNINCKFIRKDKNIWINEISDDYFQFIEINLEKGITGLYLRWGIGFYKIPIYTKENKLCKLNIKEKENRYHILETSRYEDLSHRKGKTIDGKTFILIMYGSEHFFKYENKYFKYNNRQINNFLKRTSIFDKAIDELISHIKDHQNHIPNLIITYSFYLAMNGKTDEGIKNLEKYKFNDKKEKENIQNIINGIK